MIEPDPKLLPIAEEVRRHLREACRAERTRPVITLKLATTLDARIATKSGFSRWITSQDSRQLTHLLRAHHDAILIGRGTALADDPSLTCRIAGYEEHSPIRVVVDSQLRLSLSSQLVNTANDVPVWVACASDADADRERDLVAKGVRVLRLPVIQGSGLDLRALAHALHQNDVGSVFVEGGGAIAASLLKARLVDRLVWFQAPKIMGGDGVPAIQDLDLDILDAMVPFTRIGTYECGPDLVQFFEAEA